CFSRLWVLTRPKLRLLSAKPSESQRSRSRFRCRNVQKQPTQNIVGKKRAGQEETRSDYLFGNFLQLPAFRLTVPVRGRRYAIACALGRGRTRADRSNAIPADPGGFLSPFGNVAERQLALLGPVGDFRRPGTLPDGINGQIRVECLNCLRR